MDHYCSALLLLCTSVGDESDPLSAPKLLWRLVLPGAALLVIFAGADRVY